MKLEEKHLVPYLPYKLKVVEWYLGKQIHDEFIVDCVNWDGKNIGGSDASLDSFELERMFNLRDIKPILRPLSSMTKEEAYELGILLISEADMEDKEVGIGEMRLMGVAYPTIVYKDKEDEEYSVTIQFSSIGISGVDLIPYEAYEWLFKHHFDVFGLIGKGLAIAK